MRCSRPLIASACALLLLGQARADNWPQWRGPTYNGLSKEMGLPTEWGADKNVVWKAPLPGRGGSTPVVWGDRIFLTSEDGKGLALVCLSTQGKQLWKKAMGKVTPRARGDEGDGAGATPSTDGKHVWAFVANGELGCFDFDGNEVWRINVQKRYGAFRIAFGLHSTPVLYRDRLYLQLIHDGGGQVVALDKATGKQAWRVDRKSDGFAENKHSYASPTLWQKGDDAYLITHGNDYTIAHRLSDGSEIWRVGGLNPKDEYEPTLRFVSSPAATPNLIIIPTAKYRGVVGLWPNAMGLIMPGSRFDAWRLPNNTPDVASPLIVDGLVYLNRDGELVCVEGKSGKLLYKQRIHGGRYRASPVYADGKVYCQARDGTVTVVKAGPKFERLAVNKLPDQTSASLAVANGRIYVRGFTALYAIGAR
jgi:outer membrane protein assembly factor BamB